MKRKVISMLLILCICSIIPVNTFNNTTQNDQNGISYYSDDDMSDLPVK